MSQCQFELKGSTSCGLQIETLANACGVSPYPSLEHVVAHSGRHFVGGRRHDRDSTTVLLVVAVVVVVVNIAVVMCGHEQEEKEGCDRGECDELREERGGLATEEKRRRRGRGTGRRWRRRRRRRGRKERTKV